MSFNSLMHPRNIYCQRPNFEQMSVDFPEFAKFVIRKGRKFTVDFNNPCALRSLTKTLLKKDFGLTVEIPDNCLIPTIPQRLNYILWVEDLLVKAGLKTDIFKGIDIGTGPCCVFSLIGAKKNGWHFLATEIDEKYVECAQRNVELNSLQEKIIVQKVEHETMLKELFTTSDKFDFCMCNPPFFCNFEELQRKKKLSLDAKQQEVIVNGGEVEFVKRIINESLLLKEKIKIYTSMLGRKQSVQELTKYLKTVDSIKYTCTEFGQGNTMRWGIAWTFLPVLDLGMTSIMKRKRKKEKPALTFTIPRENALEPLSIKEVVENIKSVLNEFQVSYHVVLLLTTNAHIRMTAYENTWTHQRRKRRQMMKSKTTEIPSSLEKECHNKPEFLSKVLEKAVYNSEEPGSSLSNTNFTLPSVISNSSDQIHERPYKRKFEECDETEVVQNKRILLNAVTSSEPEEKKQILNCDLLMNAYDDNINLQFLCNETVNRETMHQIYQLLKKRLTTN